MKPKIKFIFLQFLFVLLLLQNATAQTQYDATAKLKLSALSFLDYYAAINIIEDNDGLRACFESASVRMPNLILQDNKLADSLTLDQYVVRYNDFVYTKKNEPTSIAVIPYQILLDTVSSEVINVAVAAQLYLKTINANQVHISDTLDVTFELVYHVIAKGFKIKAITQNVPRGKYLIVKAIRKRSFLDSFKGLQDTSIQKLIQYNLLVNGRDFKTDSNGLIFLHDVKLNKSTRININTANYLDFGGLNFSQNRLRMVYANPKLKSTQAVYFRKSTFFLEANFGINYFIASNPIQSSATIENINLKMSTKGLGLGIYLFNKPKWESALVLGYSSYVADNASFLKSHKEQFLAIDPDGSKYLRINEITDINEFQHLNFTTVSATLQMAYKFSPKTKLNLSLRFAKMLNGTVQRESDATALYSGLYTDYFNVKISENGVYDFGSYQLFDSTLMQLSPQITFYGLQMGIERSISKKIAASFGFAILKSKQEMFQPQNKSLSVKYDQLESLLLIDKIQHFISITTFQLSLKYKL
jgi:hypothetical protein